jgi:hypothetical protein
MSERDLIGFELIVGGAFMEEDVVIYYYYLFICNWVLALWQ